jgi:hypothetical protein
MFIDIPAPGGWFVDGGLAHNNPSELALAEARNIWTSVKRFCLVSIGTGQQTDVEFVNIDLERPPIITERKSPVLKFFSKVPGAKGIGKATNAPSGLMKLKKIGEACVHLSTNSEYVHQRVFKSATSLDPDVRFPYHRFNVERGLDSIGLQEWKKVVTMAQRTNNYMAQGEGQMKRDSCVKDLLEPSALERK